MSETDAQKWCKGMNNIPYYECSAKTGANVYTAFQIAIRSALQKRASDQSSSRSHTSSYNRRADEKSFKMKAQPRHRLRERCCKTYTS